jgi:hypothetical protein
MLAGYLGSTDKFDALAQYSQAYGDEAEGAFETIQAAICSGPCRRNQNREQVWTSCHSGNADE